MKKLAHRVVTLLASAMLASTAMFAGVSQASMISTASAMESQQLVHDRTSLMSQLNESGVREQLSDMGVDAQQLEERIAALTPDELAELNARIHEMPAGEGAAGILLTIFIVFVITDMLCATDIFKFVNCINR